MRANNKSEGDDFVDDFVTNLLTGGALPTCALIRRRGECKWQV